MLRAALGKCCVLGFAATYQWHVLFLVGVKEAFFFCYVVFGLRLVV
jgi:hypothetical protein